VFQGQVPLTMHSLRCDELPKLQLPPMPRWQNFVQWLHQALPEMTYELLALLINENKVVPSVLWDDDVDEGCDENSLTLTWAFQLLPTVSFNDPDTAEWGIRCLIRVRASLS